MKDDQSSRDPGREKEEKRASVGRKRGAQGGRPGGQSPFSFFLLLGCLWASTLFLSFLAFLSIPFHSPPNPRPFCLTSDLADNVNDLAQCLRRKECDKRALMVTALLLFLSTFPPFQRNLQHTSLTASAHTEKTGANLKNQSLFF